MASGPPADTGNGTWLAVAVAASAAALVLTGLILLPGRRTGGSRFAAAVLALQAAAGVVAGAVLIGAALHSEALVRRPDDAEQAASLVRLTGLDGGNAGFFRMVAVLTLVLGVLVVVLLAMAARFAAGGDRVERTLAGGLLALEALASGVALGLVVLGHRSLPFALPALALPALLLALVSCWPPASASDGDVGYNGPHG